MYIPRRWGVIACAFIVPFLLLSGCSSHQAKCPIGSLVLNGNQFPERTRIGQLQLQVNEKSIESAYRAFSYGSSDVIHWVDHWGSERAAKQEFDDSLETIFDVDRYMGPWETPKDLYKSSNAEYYRAACGIAHGEFQCRMIASYKEYSVYLKAAVSDQWINLSKVNELLRAIDKRMLECTISRKSESSSK